MDALEPTLDGQIKMKEGWTEFKLDEASWIQGGKVWILELQPADSPPSRRDLEETHETRNAEIVELKYSSVQSKQSQEMGVPSIQEYQQESDEITSSIPGHLQVKETFIGNGGAFSQSLMLTTHPRSQCEKLLHCDQRGKAFPYPSELARHQRVHSRQKAKCTHSPSKAGSPSSLKPAPRALQVESMFTNSRKVLSQNSNVTTNQSSRRRRQCFCDQCGKAFRYPSDLGRHQRVHTRRKAKWSQSQSEVESPSLLESTVWALQMENTFTKSSRASHQKSKAMTGQNTRLRKRYFCDQCGEAFPYPSKLARHQRRHSKQKAKHTHSPSKAGSPSSLKPAPRALQVESMFTNSRKVLSQNSNVTTNQSSCRRRQCFCDQCGKAFPYPSDLGRHQRVHTRRKAKQSQSQSEVESPSLLESRMWALQMENTFTKSSRASHQKSKAMTGQNTRLRKRYFCDQCGKAFPYPSDLARHQVVHSRQKAAKWAQSPSEADNCSPLELTPLITLLDNISINSSKVLRRNSKVTADQSHRRRKRRFCDQCGEAFHYPSVLDRRWCAHSEQKAAKQGQSKAGRPGSSQTLAKKSKTTTEQSTHHRRQSFCEQCGKAFRFPSDLARHQDVHSRQKRILSQSEADSPISLEPTPVEPQVESPFTNSSQELHQDSKVTTDQSSRCSKLPFCGQCGKAFWCPSDLAQHQHVHSRREAAVPLPTVPQRANALANPSEAVRPSSTRTTDRNTDTKKPYLCDQCGESFSWCSELTQHEYTHFQERPYDCGVCGRQFRRRVQLVKHRKWHEDSQEREGEMFQNMDLDDGIGEYTLRELLQDLPPNRTGELCKPFVSPACDAGANDTPELHPVNSIWEIGISGQPYLMPLLPACERGCCETKGEGSSSTRPTKPALLQGEVTSNTTLMSAASSCEFFTTMPTVPAASPGAHGHIASMPKEKTSTASTTVDHIARPPQTISPDCPRQPWKQACSSVQGAKPHSCPICSKCFRVAGYLKKHLNTHRLGKPYSCIFCGKKFGRDSYLAKHYQRIHSEVPKRKTSTASTAVDHVARLPQAVSPDPEWLPSMDRLRQPQKQASSSVQEFKPHACPICSKRFRVAEYLKKHLNIHRLGKPYSCIFCRKRFGQLSYLARHYQRTHSKVGSHLPMTQQLLVSTL